MKITIVGNDKVDMCNVPKRNKDRVFFKLRTMTYQVVAMDFVRLRTIKYGHKLEQTEECIMFQEGRIYPYHRKCALVNYNAKAIQADMDIKKINFAQKHKFGGSFLANLDNAKLWPVIVIGALLLGLAATISAGGSLF